MSRRGPSTPDNVNQLIHQPLDARAQQSVQATLLTWSPQCIISMVDSLLTILARVLWIVLHQRRSVQGIGAMIGIAQSGW